MASQSYFLKPLSGMVSADKLATYVRSNMKSGVLLSPTKRRPTFFLFFRGGGSNLKSRKTTSYSSLSFFFFWGGVLCTPTKKGDLCFWGGPAGKRPRLSSSRGLRAADLRGSCLGHLAMAGPRAPLARLGFSACVRRGDVFFFGLGGLRWGTREMWMAKSERAPRLKPLKETMAGGYICFGLLNRGNRIDPGLLRQEIVHPQ